ncbi:MAG: DUF928 domain-containing protein [Magnetococcus sp. DMHC-6]
MTHANSPPIKSFIFFFFLITLFLGGYSLAQAEDLQNNEEDLIAYTPPARGSPSGRLGGGVRGINTKIPKIKALVPNHVGFSTQDQPTLVWYINIPAELKVAISPLEEKSANSDSIFETTINVEKAGYQTLDLAQFNFKLKPEMDYKWTVTYLSEKDNRPVKVFSGGAIRHAPMEEHLKSTLNATAAQNVSDFYAKEGYWYDAVYSLTKQIQNNTDNTKHLAKMANLLKQVGLTVP